MSENPNKERTVPEVTFHTVRSKLEKAEKELSQLRTQNAQLNSELRIAKSNLDDEGDVKAVRAQLVEEADKLDKMRAELEQRETGVKEKERASQLQTLVSTYEVDIEQLQHADDPEKEALRLYAKRLKEEKENKSPGLSPEDVVERASVSTLPKKSVIDMSKEEFGNYEKQLKVAASKH